jgi:hypothetical protein
MGDACGLSGAEASLRVARSSLLLQARLDSGTLVSLQAASWEEVTGVFASSKVNRVPLGAGGLRVPEIGVGVWQ